MHNARKAANQALAIDPMLADAYLVRAWIQTNEGDPAGAEGSLRRTLAIDPQNADAALQLAQR